MTTLLQVVRVPVLLALLIAAGQAQEPIFRAVARLQIDAMWGPWALLIGAGAAFCVVALIGREPHHSRLVLVVEGLVAAGLALVPPPLWGLQFGLSWFPVMLGASTGNFFLIALALAWLVVVAITMVRVFRSGRRAAAPG